MAAKKELVITERAEKLRAKFNRTRAQALRENEEARALYAAEREAEAEAGKASEALAKAAEAAHIAHYWRREEAKGLPEFEAAEKTAAAYSATYRARRNAEMTRDGLAKSAKTTAAAYVGEVIRANAERLDGLKPTYKRAKDIFFDISASIGGLVWVYANDTYISVELTSAGECPLRAAGDRYIYLVPSGSRDGLISADALPQMPTDEGATLAEIRRAVAKEGTAREKIKALREKYVSDVSEILHGLSALPDDIAEDCSRVAKTYF